jgi:hypothetical protein
MARLCDSRRAGRRPDDCLVVAAGLHAGLELQPRLAAAGLASLADRAAGRSAIPATVGVRLLLLVPQRPDAIGSGNLPGGDLADHAVCRAGDADGDAAGTTDRQPWLGRLADRFGNRPVLLASLPLVAAAPLFFLPAAPERPWWAVGVYLLWIAWAGVNVGLPNLMLRLATPEDRTSYIAGYYALTGLCLAASTILGGLLFDNIRDASFRFPGVTLDFYQYLFLVAWLGRTLCVGLLWLVRESTPGGCEACSSGDERSFRPKT